MRRIIPVFIVSLFAQPALAEGLSPIQMYLKGEVGYAPPMAAAPQAVTIPTPYDMAQSPPVYTAPQSSTNIGDNSRINSGIAAMNN